MMQPWYKAWREVGKELDKAQKQAARLAAVEELLTRTAKELVCTSTRHTALVQELSAAGATAHDAEGEEHQHLREWQSQTPYGNMHVVCPSFCVLPMSAALIRGCEGLAGVGRNQRCCHQHSCG